MNDSFFRLPDDKRDKIIGAGYRVFSRYSYKNSPMSEIAAEAGISKSLLFYYFKNKKELYLFLCSYSTELTEREMIRQKCYEKEDFFDIFLSGLKVKVQLMRQYPDLSLFQLKAYYERDKSLRPEINRLIGKYSEFGSRSEILKLDKDRFIEGLDLEMMYTDMFLASQGYLWEKLQGDSIDPDAMERDLVKLIGFWRQLYSRKA
ncbi:MAG: TetR/AcrR family transcriptional regulator [Oscillospiraceae bacterium]|nr:TetR/AcrR family transcriptional regulator [Oscillospiraceae bacterium]